MKAGKRGGNGHTNDAFRCSLASPDSRSRVFKVVENAQSRLVKVATCFSQGNRTRAAVKKFGAELIFKGGDLFADSRLADSTFLRDSGEAAFFNYPDEHVHCIESVHTSLRIPLWNGLSARNSDSSASLPDVKNTDQKKVSSSAPCIPIRNSWYAAECQICLQ